MEERVNLNELPIQVVLDKLGQPYKTRGDYAMLECPNCGHKTLGVSLSKNVWNCPACDLKGGGPVRLYKIFTDGLNDNNYDREFYKKMEEDILGNRPVEIVKREVGKKVKPQKPESKIADIEMRDVFYKKMIEVFPLYKKHKSELTSARGFKESDLEKYGYVSYPTSNLDIFAAKFRQAGLIFEGIPGTYKSKKGFWSFIRQENEGFLIPMRNEDHKIVGMQLRQDNVKDAKYIHLSSSNWYMGTKAVQNYHIAIGSDMSIFNEKCLILTEGPLKADIVNYHTGLPVLAIPGVNAQECLNPLLEKLKNQNPNIRILIAFDMDSSKNIFVFNAKKTLMQRLDRYNLKFRDLVWDSAYKGIDDYVLNIIN